MSTSPKQRKNAHLELASVGAHMYVMTRRKRKRREIDGKKPRTHVLATLTTCEEKTGNYDTTTTTKLKK